MDLNFPSIPNQKPEFKFKNKLFKKPLHSFKVYLAKQYSKLYSKELYIGITGSVSKNICIKAATIVLSQKYNTLSATPYLNPLLDTPRTLLKVTPNTKKVILDLGIEQKNEIESHLSLVKPKTVVITEIFYPHSEALGSADDISYEMEKLIEQVPKDGMLILNWDDPNSKKLAEKCKGNLIYFGTDPKNCAIWAGNVKLDNFRTSFELNLGVERVKVELQLLGLHYVLPFLAAATLGVINNISLTKIKLALESIQSQEHNFQPLYGPNGSVILDDTLNSSPAEVDLAIDTMMKIPARRRVLVLGEIKGLGIQSEKVHRSIAQKIYKEKIDQVYLGTGDASIIGDELKSLGFWEEKLQINLQNSQLVGKLLKGLSRGDICLIKGSRSVRLDEVVKRITKRQ